MKRYLIFAPILSLFVLVFTFFYPVFFQGKIPIAGDTIVGLYHPFRDFYSQDYPNGIPFKNFLVTDPVRQQYPWRLLVIDNLRNLSLPLWNKYQGVGTPLLANFQSASFYPFNVLFFFLPFISAWSWLVMLQVFLAGLFLYLYLRFLRLHPIAALVGGISFSFSGFSIAWLEWNTILHTMMWVPFILLVKELFLRTQEKKWLVASVIGESSLIFAGHIQTAFYAFLVINSYLFARLYQVKRSEFSKNNVFYYFTLFKPFIISGVITALITSLQWIPTLHFIFLSARDADQMDWHVSGWFIPWQHLVQYLAPDFFGNPSTLNYWGVWNYGELVGYIGIIPLIFALYSLLFRRDKKTVFFATLFFLSLLFSLPTIFAKLPFILDIPFLSTSQPTRLLSVATFSLAILCSLGIDLYIKKRWRIFYPLFIVALCLSCLWIVSSFFLGMFGITQDQAATARNNLKLPSILFAVTLLLFSIDSIFKKRWMHQLTLIVLLLITCFDLMRFGWKFTPFSSREYLYPNTNIISFLKNDHSLFRVMTSDNRLLPPNFSSVYQIESVDLYDPLYFLRYGELIAAIERGKPSIAPPFGFNRIITPHNYSSPLTNLLNVKYVLSLTDISSERFSRVYEEGNSMVFENADVLPRAFFIKNLISAKDKNDSISYLFQNASDLKNVAVVEGWKKDKIAFSSGEVSSITYKNNTVSVKVRSAGEAFLVFLDSYYPSWKAAIQTKDAIIDTPIYLTDFAFRGVVVPPGEHTIIFSMSLI